MRKKLLTIILSAFMFILSMPLTVYAETVNKPKDAEWLVDGSVWYRKYDNPSYRAEYNIAVHILEIGGIGEIPDFVDELDEGTKSPFLNNQNIDTIKINEGITKIGKHVFDGCENVIRLASISTTPPTLKEDVLKELSSDLVIVVPNAKVDDYKNADNWKANDEIIHGAYFVDVEEAENGKVIASPFYYEDYVFDTNAGTRMDLYCFPNEGYQYVVSSIKATYYDTKDNNYTVTSNGFGAYFIMKRADAKVVGAEFSNVKAAFIEGTAYPSLESAILAANDGDIIKIKQRINTIKEPIIIDRNITIDKYDEDNIKTITAAGSMAFDVTGKLTLNNITINTKNSGIAVHGRNSELTIGDTTIVNAASALDAGLAEKAYGIKAYDGAKLTVNGTIKNTYGDAAIICGDSIKDRKSTITINDGASINSKSNIAIYLPNKVDLIIEGGTISGTTGIYQKSGTLTINNGTISGMGNIIEYSISTEAEPIESVNTGDAVVFDNTGYIKGIPVVNINGGAFSSKNGSCFGTYSISETKYPHIRAFVKGGMFNKELDSELIASDKYANYNQINNEDEATKDSYPYVVVKDDAVATIRNHSYSTLEKAIADVKNGQTIKLLKDNNESIKISKAITFNIDSNGKAFDKTKVNISDDYLDLKTSTNGELIKFEITKHDYKIIYKDQGNKKFSGVHEKNYPTTFHYDESVSLKGATKPGYTFVGWYLDEKCSDNKRVKKLAANTYKEDITLYAKWEINKYKLSFTSDENGSVSRKSIFVPYGTPYFIHNNVLTIGLGFGSTIVTATPNDGYMFESWNIEPINMGIITEDTLIEANFEQIVAEVRKFDTEKIIPYASLQEALENAEDFDVVVLQKDLQLTSDISIGNYIFLDLNNHKLNTTGNIINNGGIYLYNKNMDIIEYLIYEVQGAYTAGEKLLIPNANNPELIIPEGTFFTSKVGSNPYYHELRFALGDGYLVWNTDINKGVQLKVTYDLALSGDIIAPDSDNEMDTYVEATRLILNDDVTVGSSIDEDGKATLFIKTIDEDTIGEIIDNGYKLTLNNTGEIIVSVDAKFDNNIIVSGDTSKIVDRKYNAENNTYIYRLTNKPTYVVPKTGVN